MNMYASEALRACQGEQPHPYQLTQSIADMLEQYGAKIDIKCTRLPNILAETMELAGETGAQIAALHAETLVAARMKGYVGSVAMLEEMQAGHVAEILSRQPNNDNVAVSMAA